MIKTLTVKKQMVGTAGSGVVIKREGS